MRIIPKNFVPASFPYIPGSAVAGVVEEVGSLVTTFQKGQAVFGRSTNGAYAEYTTTAVDAPALVQRHSVYWPASPRRSVLTKQPRSPAERRLPGQRSLKMEHCKRVNAS